MTSLRQRIRIDGIRCQPWRVYRHEVALFCVSGKCLVMNRGVPIDVLEIELQEEGWLLPEEALMDVLGSEDRLRQRLEPAVVEDAEYNDLSEDDYIANGWA